MPQQATTGPALMEGMERMNAVVVRGAGVGQSMGTPPRRNPFAMEVAKLAIFNGKAGRVGGFITACRLYIKMKLRENMVEEQVQWVLTYV